MKRSEINSIIREARELMNEHSWYLPAWADWTKEDWAANKDNCDNLFLHNLGWDITDFGSGDFQKRGLFLFTLRNGLPGGAGKSYAEKIMVVGEDQETPYHFHWNKMEDIINRGGGTLLFNLYKATEDEKLSNEPLTVMIDDCPYRINAGEPIGLKPGQSLTLEPYVYHRFYGAVGEGPVLTGEVSKVNDDAADNRFLESLGRFPAVEEDEAPLRYLCSDYEKLKKEIL